MIGKTGAQIERDGDKRGVAALTLIFGDVLSGGTACFAGF